MGAAGPFDEIIEYNPATDTCVLQPCHLPTPLFGLSCAFAPEAGMFYCFGGEDTLSGGGYRNEIIEFGPGGTSGSCGDGVCEHPENNTNCAPDCYCGNSRCDDDETSETIPIVYGVDLSDWWNVDDSKEVERGKVVWEGTTRSFGRGVQIRLYLATWENPHPEKKVTSITYVSTGTTEAAPFCVAMTAEK